RRGDERRGHEEGRGLPVRPDGHDRQEGEGQPPGRHPGRRAEPRHAHRVARLDRPCSGDRTDHRSLHRGLVGPGGGRRVHGLHVLLPRPTAPGPPAQAVERLGRQAPSPYGCLHPVQPGHRPHDLRDPTHHPLRPAQPAPPPRRRRRAHRQGDRTVKTATEATTIRRASGRVARALVPVLILLAAVFSLGMVNAQSASALDLTASGETLNSANPFLGGGDQMILAEEADANVGDVTSSACTNTGKGGSTKATNCLPIFRWATGMTMISNVQFTLSQPLDSVSSNLVAKNSITAFMVVGNLRWYIAAFMMDVATNYEIATAIMKPINEFAATIGGALTGSAILGGIVAIGLVTATFSFLRRGFNPKRLLVMVGTLGVLAMMISGSMQDTGSGDDYEPGFGSPAWVAQKSADIFKSIADPVASSVAESADASSDALFSDGAKEDPYSCYTYVEHLYDGYEQNSKGGSQATAIMSRWWMNTSYK